MSLTSCSLFLTDDKYSARVQSVSLERVANAYKLTATLDYQLSPLAKEALHKGIALTWRVLIKVKQKNKGWDSSLYFNELVYRVKYHTLLNLYSVNKGDDEGNDMHSTLTGALYSIAKIRQMTLHDEFTIPAHQQYYLEMKILFDREALPVPLRALSYFDPQWALSSKWSTWPLQN